MDLLSSRPTSVHFSFAFTLQALAPPQRAMLRYPHFSGETHPARGGGLSLTCSAGSEMAKPSSWRNHTRVTRIGTEGHFLLAPADDWGFSGSIMVGWKVFLAQESKTSERARCVWDTGNHLCVEGCGMRPQTRGGPDNHWLVREVFVHSAC